MAFIMVDVESDGPIPGDFSMVCFGAILIEAQLETTFYGQLRPISNQWQEAALVVSGFNREETLCFDEPEAVMRDFENWVHIHGGEKPVFISDNNGYDWSFINWYFHHFIGHNPFGYSSVNLGSLYKGLVKDMSQSFKHLRRTIHSHHPVDDVRGNAEALLHMQKAMGLVIKF